MSAPAKSPPKRFRKWIFRISLVFFLLLAAAGVWLWFWVSANINAAEFVRQLEKEKNLRCEIDSVELDLFAQPAILNLHGVRFAARDDYATRRVPLGERTPMAADSVLVSMETASIRVGLWSLISRKLDLRKLVASDLVVTGTIDEEGGNNIEDLFQKPPRPDNRVPVDKEKAKGPSKPDLFTEIGLAGVESGSMQFLLKEDQKVIRLEPLRILFDGVVDPENLKENNTLQMDFAGDLHVEDVVKGTELALLHITARGPVNPYDPETGKFDPLIDVRMDISKGSMVAVTPVRELLKDREDDIKRLEDIGLDIDRFSAGGPMEKDASIHLIHDRTRTTLQDDIMLWFPEFSLGLEKGDFVDVNERFVRVHPKFTASPGVSEELISMVRQKLAKETNEDIATVLALLLEPLRDDEGRISLTLKGRGPFDDVEWSIDNPLSDVGDVIGDAVGGLLEGILGKDGEDKKKEEEKKKQEEEEKRRKREEKIQEIREQRIREIREQRQQNNPAPAPPQPPAPPKDVPAAPRSPAAPV